MQCSCRLPISHLWRVVFLFLRPAQIERDGEKCTAWIIKLAFDFDDWNRKLISIQFRFRMVTTPVSSMGSCQSSLLHKHRCMTQAEMLPDEVKFIFIVISQIQLLPSSLSDASSFPESYSEQGWNEMHCYLEYNDTFSWVWTILETFGIMWVQ